MTFNIPFLVPVGLALLMLCGAHASETVEAAAAVASESPETNINGSARVIVLATPIFLFLIGLELLWSRWYHRKGASEQIYRLSDSINSISLGILSQISGILTKVLTIGIYAVVFDLMAIFPKVEFWTTWYGIALALIVYDFCYYWLHRAGHEVAVLWAAHVVHHQSELFNLSTALRQTSSGTLLGWIFYLPLAIIGIPPSVMIIVGLIDLLYQFWVHTELIGKLGWFDRVFASPSNHRVHHAVNDKYVDRNYGGVFMIWDRLFGSFQEEDVKDPCVYGTRSPLRSWDPLWANIEVYWNLAKETRTTHRWSDKLRVWLKFPGWQSEEMKASHPKPAFRLDSVTTYDPPLTPVQQWFATLHFLLSLAGVSLFLWNSGSMERTEAATWILGIAFSMWSIGRFMQGNLSMTEMLMLDGAILTTAGYVAKIPALMLLKPTPLILAMIFVIARARSTQKKRSTLSRFDLLMLCALFFSLGGDVLLMIPGFFIPGVASFLIAHLFYIALFRQGQAWLPSRNAVAVIATFGCAMYAILWSSLTDPALKVALAAYIAAIGIAAAQAIGRAIVLNDEAARWTAVGACIFMLSDSLLAIDRFLIPIPVSSLWILMTYFLAQMMIVHNCRPTGTPSNQ